MGKEKINTLSAIEAFTEWLAEQKKSYLLLVYDANGEGDNVVAANGKTSNLSIALAGAMGDTKEIRELVKNALLALVHAQMKNLTDAE